MNTIWGKLKQFFDKEPVYTDKLGKWIALKLTNQLKTILCNTLYRIPNYTRGVYFILSQYNQSDRKIKNATKYRKEILNEIIQYIEGQRNINDILIVENYNQFIETMKYKNFTIKLE